MRVTLKDVSELANVAVSSVSDVLNQRDVPYSDSLKERVLKAAAELGYKPNGMARGLRTGLSNTIGLVIPNRNYSYFADIAIAIEKCAKARNMHVITVFTTDAEDAEALCPDELDDLSARQVDGIIATPGADTPVIAAAYRRAIKSGQHIVLLDVELSGVGAPFVGTDDYGSAREATAYLISKGHRAIAHISGAFESPTGRARLHGYRSALEAAGFEANPGLVFGRSYNLRDARAAVAALLSQNTLPTAVFCANDLIAAELYKGCWERGISIPQDISVVGFCGFQMCEYLSPPLTTMVQPTDKIAEKAFSLLLSQVTDGDHNRDDLTSVRYKAELLERDSVRSICSGQTGT